MTNLRNQCILIDSHHTQELMEVGGGGGGGEGVASTNNLEEMTNEFYSDAE